MVFFETNRKTHIKRDVNDAVRKNPKTWGKNKKKHQKMTFKKKMIYYEIFYMKSKEKKIKEQCSIYCFP